METHLIYNNTSIFIKGKNVNKKFIALFFVLVINLSLAAWVGNDKYKIVRTDEFTTEAGSVMVHGYNKDDIRISETMTDTAGNVYAHKYDLEGNHIFESTTLTDGTYHEFVYDKDGNVTKETHK